jgi:hypothetical protein
VSRDTLAALLAALAARATAEDTCNPYDTGSPCGAARLGNLGRYLAAMLALPPRPLLLLEAPGYRGCRVTGLPVTSRQVMLEVFPGLPALGSGYEDPPEEGFSGCYREQSATIVWGALARLGALPLLWNAFPFHPHQPGAPLTNRTPRSSEIAEGQPYVQQVLRLFQPSLVIAVGGSAARSLRALGIPHEKIRHPAQGGKNAFTNGLERLLTG